MVTMPVSKSSCLVLSKTMKCLIRSRRVCLFSIPWISVSSWPIRWDASFFPSEDFQAMNLVIPDESVPALASKPSEMIRKALYVKSEGITAL